MKKITGPLAEDHTIVREGFRRMLELEEDIEVVGEAQDGRQAVALINKLRPAVVLMDIAMPLLNGLEATRQVLKSVPTTKVLMLSAHSDDAYVQNATESGAAVSCSNKPPPTTSAGRFGRPKGKDVLQPLRLPAFGSSGSPLRRHPTTRGRTTQKPSN